MKSKRQTKEPGLSFSFDAVEEAELNQAIAITQQIAQHLKAGESDQAAAVLRKQAQVLSQSAPKSGFIHMVLARMFFKLELQPEAWENLCVGLVLSPWDPVGVKTLVRQRSLGPDEVGRALLNRGFAALRSVDRTLEPESPEGKRYLEGD